MLDKALECLSAGLKPFVVGCDLVGCNFFCGSVNFWWRRISGHFWNFLRGQRSYVNSLSLELFPTSSLIFSRKNQTVWLWFKLRSFFFCWELCGSSIAVCEAAHRGLFLHNSFGSKITSREIISLFYNKACISNSANMGFATGFVSSSLLSGYSFFHAQFYDVKADSNF